MSYTPIDHSSPIIYATEGYYYGAFTTPLPAPIPVHGCLPEVVGLSKVGGGHTYMLAMCLTLPF